MQHFTELELPEDSSDEEYNPAEDEVRLGDLTNTG